MFAQSVLLKPYLCRQVRVICHQCETGVFENRPNVALPRTGKELHDLAGQFVELMQPPGEVWVNQVTNLFHTLFHAASANSFYYKVRSTLVLLRNLRNLIP